MLDNWDQHSLKQTLWGSLVTLTAVFFFTLSWLISCTKLVRAAETVTETRIRGKGCSTPQLHTSVQRHWERINSTRPDLELTSWDHVNGSLVGAPGDWQAGSPSAPPGRHQRAAVLPLSELCSGPLCLTYICTWQRTHTQTHTQMQMRMDTHMSGCKAIRLSIILGLTHTHPHTPSHYAPAVKSQLNDESPALLPLCIQAEEPVIACMEQYVCMPLFQLQHHQPTWGIVS